MSQRFCLNWGKGAKQKVERLLEAGQNINDPTDNYGYSLLHHSVEIERNADSNTSYESGELTRLLIEKGADLNARDCCGRSPLMIAINSYNLNAVKALLEGGSDVAACCDFGKSVLHYTFSNPHPDVAEMLIKRGADVNKVDSSGMTLLQDALEDGHRELVNFLLKNTSLQITSNPCTSLTQQYQYKLVRAAFWGKNDEIQSLLCKDIDIDSKDRSGNTALICAIRSGKFKTIRFLLDAGANVESRDISGNTPLHWACKQTLPDIIKLILEHGADPNVKSDGSLCTPFVYAVNGLRKSVLGQTQRPSPVIAHLLDYGALIYYPEYVKCQNLYFQKNSKLWSEHPEISVQRHIAKDDIDSLSSFERQILSHDLKLRVAAISSFRTCFEMREYEVKYYKWDCSLKRSPQFRSRCIQEIALLKTTSIGGISLYEFLAVPSKKLNCKLTHKTITQLLKNEKYADNLPIYWGMIEAKLVRLMMKQSLMESSFNFFTFLKPLLPYDCVDIILTYLSLNDMKNLKQIAFKFELNVYQQH